MRLNPNHMHRWAIYKAYQYADKADVQTTSEGKSILKYAYKFYSKKGVLYIMETLGGRKFITTILLLVLNFVLFYTGNITGEDWKWLVTAVFGIYVAGNSLEKFTK